MFNITLSYKIIQYNKELSLMQLLFVILFNANIAFCLFTLIKCTGI